MDGHSPETPLWSERARAKAELDASPVWIDWRAAHTSTLLEAEACVEHGHVCFSISIGVLADQLLDVKGQNDLEALDTRSPVLRALAATRHVERLEQQLTASAAWRSFAEAHERIHEVQSMELLERMRAMEQRRAAARDARSVIVAQGRIQSAARPSRAPSLSLGHLIEPAQPSSTLTSTSANSASPSDCASTAASSTELHSSLAVAVLAEMSSSGDTASSYPTAGAAQPAATAVLPLATAPSCVSDASTTSLNSTSMSAPASCSSVASSTSSVAPEQTVKDTTEDDVISASTQTSLADATSLSSVSANRLDDAEYECDYGEDDGGALQLEPVRAMHQDDSAAGVGSDRIDCQLPAGDTYRMQAVHGRHGASIAGMVEPNNLHHTHVRLDTDAALGQEQVDNHLDSVSPRESRKRRHSFSDSEDGRDRPRPSQRRLSIMSGSTISTALSHEADRRSIFVQCREFVRKEDVHRWFAHFGQIERVDMPHRPSGRPIAFVHFFDSRDARDAVYRGQDHASGILTVKPYQRRSPN